MVPPDLIPVRRTSGARGGRRRVYAAGQP